MLLPEIIIFDLGGVLLDFTYHYENPQFLSRFATSPENVRRFFDGGPFHDFERGKIGRRVFFELARERIAYAGDFDSFQKDMNPNFSLNEEMFRYFLKLKVRFGKTVAFWMLSNINEIHHEYAERFYPGVFSNFLEVFLSYRLGCRKPDHEIYDRILAIKKKRPNACLFIDDLEKNGLHPTSLGMQFIKFEGVDSLRVTLQSMYQIAV